MSIKLTHELMDLIWHYSKSSIGLSESQHERVKSLWSALTDSGKEYFELWAEDNDFLLPTYCR